MYRGRQLAEQANDGAEEQFRNGDGVAGGRVDDGDAELGGDIERDVVHAHPSPSHHAQLLACAQELRGNPRGAPSHNGVVVADALKERVFRERWDFVYDERGFGSQQGHAFRIDIVRDEHAIGHECTKGKRDLTTTGPALQTEVVAAQGVAQHVPKAHEQVVARGRGIVADEQFHAVGDGDMSPTGNTVLFRRCGIEL